MAAIILKPDHKLDGAEIYKQLVGRLPSYAWPWFLRIQVRKNTNYISKLLRWNLGSVSPWLFLLFLDLPGNDGDVQTAEGETGPRGLQPSSGEGAPVFHVSLSEGLHFPFSKSVRWHHLRQDFTVDRKRSQSKLNSGWNKRKGRNRLIHYWIYS